MRRHTPNTRHLTVYDVDCAFSRSSKSVPRASDAVAVHNTADTNRREASLATKGQRCRGVVAARYHAKATVAPDAADSGFGTDDAAAASGLIRSDGSLSLK